MEIHNIFYILLGVISLTICVHSQSEDRSKRILIEDSYYTIVSKLDNLTKEVQKLRDGQHTKRVAFKASLTSSLSGLQKQRHIIFDNVELNLGNAYNNLHGNFIAPVSGMYLFSIYACSFDDHYTILDLMKNGVTAGRLLAGDKDWTSCNSDTFILQLNTGDDIYVTEQGGDLLYVYNTFGTPHFLGVLINTN